MVTISTEFCKVDETVNEWTHLWGCINMPHFKANDTLMSAKIIAF